MSLVYVCAVSGVSAYGEPNEHKGTAIRTFEPPQWIFADEHRSEDGRLWLRFKIKGQDVYSLWADVEGRPYWDRAPGGADNTASKPKVARGPHGSINTVRVRDGLLCRESQCRQTATFKCDRCSKVLCLDHQSRFFTAGTWMRPSVAITCCRACKSHYTDHRNNVKAFCWVLLIVVLVAVSAFVIWLIASGNIN